MPGAYPRTSPGAHERHASLREALANTGIEKAIETDRSVRTSMNTYQGKITNSALAEAMEER